MAFTSYTQLVSEMNKRTTIAVKNTSEKLCEKLKELIQTEYYNQYDPTSYIPRTYKFLESAVAKMVTDSTATIGIDDSYFDYEYPVRYTSQSANITKEDNVHWTGEDQIEMSSRGYHGSAYIRTDGRWFEAFKEYCDKNARAILRDELIKQKVPIK